jgi:poly(3-hydroxybutyrate) depolymerase
MARGRLIAGLVAAALAVAVALPAAAAAERPVVLLIHGGAWLFGDASDMQDLHGMAREEGFKPVSVDYPLKYPIRANLYTQRVARYWAERGRTVYAYGESVGGTMAEVLAARCLVAATAANSAPPDLIRWPEPDQPSIFPREPLRPYSPFHQRQCSPVLAMHSPDDGLVDFRFAREYAQRYNQVTLRRISGVHVGEGARRRATARAGLHWLALQATRFQPVAVSVSATLR